MTVEQIFSLADAYRGRDLGQRVFDEVREALQSGQDRDHLIPKLTTLYDHLGDAGREEDQDAIADVLDALTGFCSPSAAL